MFVPLHVFVKPLAPKTTHGAGEHSSFLLFLILLLPVSPTGVVVFPIFKRSFAGIRCTLLRCREKWVEVLSQRGHFFGSVLFVPAK